MAESAATLWALIDAAATAHPDRILFADDHGRSLTAERYRDAAERVAAGLGVRPGQIVSWQLPTVLEAPVLLAALARLGVVQNPLITVLRERELGLIAGRLAPELLIVPRVWRGFGHADMAGTLGGKVLALDLESIGPGDAALRLPQGDPATLPPPPVDPAQVRWLYFTSGTTAEPKGARHTDSSVIASSNTLTDALAMSDGDVLPVAWPYAHIGGASMTAAVLRRGGRLVLFDTFDPSTTPERMAVHRPTLLGAATPFFRAYLDAQRGRGEPLYPALRACLNGGAPMAPDLAGELRRALGVRHLSNSWGLTEFPCATAVAAKDPADGSGSVVGRPAAGVQVRVVDGELRLRGPQCFAGYVDAGLDAAAFDDEGWLRTGDLGAVDTAGFVSVTGRSKDIVIRNAENISVLEVENILRRHPDIADAVVLGLPDARTGERVCAVVAVRSGEVLTVESIGAHCRAAGLARHKTPVQVETVAELPRNAMGKVLKEELRTRFGSR